MPVGSEEQCSVPTEYSVGELDYEECFGFVEVWEAVSRLAQVYFVGERECVEAPR